MTLEEKYPFIASWVVDGELHIGRQRIMGISRMRGCMMPGESFGKWTTLPLQICAHQKGINHKEHKERKVFCSFSFVFFAFFVVRQKSANIVDQPFTSLDEVFEQMERGIGVWCREQGIELVDSRGRGIPFPED